MSILKTLIVHTFLSFISQSCYLKESEERKMLSAGLHSLVNKHNNYWKLKELLNTPKRNIKEYISRISTKEILEKTDKLIEIGTKKEIEGFYFIEMAKLILEEIEVNKPIKRDDDIYFYPNLLFYSIDNKKMNLLRFLLKTNFFMENNKQDECGNNILLYILINSQLKKNDSECTFMGRIQYKICYRNYKI